MTGNKRDLEKESAKKSVKVDFYNRPLRGFFILKAHTQGMDLVQQNTKTDYSRFFGVKKVSKLNSEYQGKPLLNSTVTSIFHTIS